MNLTINFGNESKVFIKGGIVGLGFVLLLFLYELYLISNGMEKRISSLSILSLEISFYFVNALKHFIIFGLSWHYLKKIKPYHSKIKLVVISVFGGIGGVIIMFIIQIGNLIFIENFKIQIQLQSMLPANLIFTKNLSRILKRCFVRRLISKKR